jgi:hypothetical protein
MALTEARRATHLTIGSTPTALDLLMIRRRADLAQQEGHDASPPSKNYCQCSPFLNFPLARDA